MKNFFMFMFSIIVASKACAMEGNYLYIEDTAGVHVSIKFNPKAKPIILPYLDKPQGCPHCIRYSFPLIFQSKDIQEGTILLSWVFFKEISVV